MQKVGEELARIVDDPRRADIVFKRDIVGTASLHLLGTPVPSGLVEYVKMLVGDASQRVANSASYLANKLKPAHNGIYISGNGHVASVTNLTALTEERFDGKGYGAATVEPEARVVTPAIHPGLWQPPDYQIPETNNLAYLDVDNILKTAKTMGFDFSRFGLRIEKITGNGKQIVGTFDPNTGMIATSDETLYIAVVRAIGSLNEKGLGYKRTGIELKV